MDPRHRALRRAIDGATDDDLVPIEQLAQESGLSLPLLEALAREGLLLARADGAVPLYHPDDAAAVRAGLELVEAGLPLGELLEVARLADQAMRPMADAALDAFVRFVSDPVEGTAASGDEAADRLVAALDAMLPTAGRLVSHHFQRLLIESARRRLGGEGTGPTRK